MLVRAHNTHGTSEPSPVTDYIKTTGRATSISQGWDDDQIAANMQSTSVELRSLKVIGSTALNATWSVSEIPVCLSVLPGNSKLSLRDFVSR